MRSMVLFTVRCEKRGGSRSGSGQSRSSAGGTGEGRPCLTDLHQSERRAYETSRTLVSTLLTTQREMRTHLPTPGRCRLERRYQACPSGGSGSCAGQRRLSGRDRT